ncbi:hypothetical protein ACQEU6_33940 [Spirillospora sp. CA-108201]
MGYPKPVLEIPPVTGNDVDEIESGIERRAREFFGTVDLAFPDRYHAKLTDDRFSDSKRYVVEGVRVQLYWSDRPERVTRSVDLPPVFGGSLTEIEAEIKRLTAEFFGTTTGVSSPRADYAVVVETDAKGDKKYKAKDVTVTHTDDWPRA